MRWLNKLLGRTEAVVDRGGIGAEGADSRNADTAPPMPASDDTTPLGDTDQHSQAPSAAGR